MKKPITQYYKENARLADRINSDALTAEGYSCCTIPKDYCIRTAIKVALELVGAQHFVPDDNNFWFESDALALQFRLMLP